MLSMVALDCPCFTTNKNCHMQKCKNVHVSCGLSNIVLKIVILFIYGTNTLRVHWREKKYTYELLSPFVFVFVCLFFDCLFVFCLFVCFCYWKKRIPHSLLALSTCIFVNSFFTFIVLLILQRYIFIEDSFSLV